MTEKESPIVSFRCPEDYLERVDSLIKSDKIAYVNRSVFIRLAVKNYLAQKEARQSRKKSKEVKVKN